MKNFLKSFSILEPLFNRLLSLFLHYINIDIAEIKKDIAQKSIYD